MLNENCLYPFFFVTLREKPKFCHYGKKQKKREKIVEEATQ